MGFLELAVRWEQIQLGSGTRCLLVIVLSRRGGVKQNGYLELLLSDIQAGMDASHLRHSNSTAM